MKVPLRNNFTGQIKFIKIGWSWTLFLFGIIYGIPLFLRRLPEMGLVVAVLAGISVMVQNYSHDEFVRFVLGTTLGVVSIWLGLNGNRLTAIRHLERGWSFAEPDSALAKLARTTWQLEKSQGAGEPQPSSPQDPTYALAANIALAQRDTLLTIVGIVLIVMLIGLPIIHYAWIAFSAPN